MKLVECVPNISEGRRPEVYDAIAKAAAAVPGVTAARRRPGRGDQPHGDHLRRRARGGARRRLPAGQGVVRAASTCASTRGPTPRMGATDVVPFVPVAGVTMEDCVGAGPPARASGSATSSGCRSTSTSTPPRAPDRRSLADIRKGEYEALPRSCKTPTSPPTSGRRPSCPRFGATVDRRAQVPGRLQRQPQHHRQAAGPTGWPSTCARRAAARDDDGEPDGEPAGHAQGRARQSAGTSRSTAAPRFR